jgi:ParB/RepB/Spo0J family partition protein
LKLKKVSPNKIKIPEVRIKGVFDEETKKLLAESMSGAGQIAPIICCEVEGELVLVDGENRLETARRLQWPLIDVAVIEGDMSDVLTRNLFLDHIRGKHTPGQMLKVIEALCKTYGLDSEKIAAKTGLKRDYIEQFQLLEALTPMVRAALDEDRIKLGHAAALAKIKDPVQQEVVFQQLTLYRWGVAELVAFVKQVLETVAPPVIEPGQTASRPVVTIPCFYCGELLTVDKISNPNTCAGCASVLLQSIAQVREQLRLEHLIEKEKESKDLSSKDLPGSSHPPT